MILLCLIRVEIFNFVLLGLSVAHTVFQQNSSVRDCGPFVRACAWLVAACLSMLCCSRVLPLCGAACVVVLLTISTVPRSVVNAVVSTHPIGDFICCSSLLNEVGAIARSKNSL